MSRRGSSAADEGSSSFLHPFKAVLRAVSSALHTRLQLLVTELEEERERLKQTLVLTLLVFFGLSFGFILLTIFVVALLWERGWIFAIGGLAGIYLAIGLGAALLLRQSIVNRPRLFPATLAELAKDRDRLRSPDRE